MHIAVNTRLLQKGKLDGIGWFSHEVLKRLCNDLPDWKFTFYFDRAFDDSFIYGPNVRGKVLFPPTRHPLLYQWYFQQSIPRALEASKANLFFSPDGFLTTKSDIKQVPVIHDINFEHRPQDLPSKYSAYYRKYFPQFAQKANRIITVSSFSADDISKTYSIDRELIDVAYNGGNELYRELNSEEKAKAKSQFAQGSDYFIFVGNFSYRKNLHGIINAYSDYRAGGGNAKLVLVGNPLWKYDEMDAALDQSTFKEDIIFTGRLDIDDLVLALGGSIGLIFPSYFEGFGIPIVEAFAAGVPVITSTKTSLPEVGGDAALYAEPDDYQLISKHLLSLEKDESFRNTLVEKGKNRSNQFSWDITANKVKTSLFHSLNLYHKGQ